MKTYILAALVAAWFLQAPAAAQTAPAGLPAQVTRGALLYNNHCVACHATKLHWREQKLVLDWRSLREQVGQWQQREMLGWNDDDVDAVARYLNDSIYKFPRTDGRIGQLRPGANMLATARAPLRK